MADITKCTSETCPQRDTCYRKRAKDDAFFQSYSNFEYECNENSGFEDYIPVLGKMD